MSRGTFGGVLAGLTPTAWKRFSTEMVCVNTDPAGAGLTQPFLDRDRGRSQFGRYFEAEGLTVVQMQLAYVANATFGAGGPYAFKLPRPARRLIPGAPAVGCLFGGAMGYLSFVAPFTNVPGVPILADPWPSLAGREDEYLHVLVPEILAWGTDSVSSGAKTITHNLGFAPSAADFIITWSEIGGGSNQFPTWISSITTTQATVNTYHNPGGTIGFGWKVRAVPPAGQGGPLMSPTSPFVWADKVNTSVGPFGNIFIEVAYEPA